MHPKLLIKYFPELAQLPTFEQEKIIREAQTRMENNTHKLHTLLGNLARAGLLLGLCLLLIQYIPSLAGISHSATATIIMVVIIPTYLFVQQRLYIRKLRNELRHSSSLFQD